MKKYITSAIMLLIFGNIVYAQLAELTLRRVELGFRLIPTISNFDMNIYGSGTVKGEATFGYGIGGMMAINISENMGVQGELIYNSLSQTFKVRNVERRIHVNYLNIPLLYCLSTGKAEPVNLSFQIGPQFGYNLGSNISSTGSGGEIDTFQATLAIRKGDIGFTYGVGLGFALNKKQSQRLDFGFREVYGLMNISNTSESPNSSSRYVVESASIRTNSIYVGWTHLF